MLTTKSAFFTAVSVVIPFGILLSIQKLDHSVFIAFLLSIFVGVITYHAIPVSQNAFIKAGLSGKDMLKPGKPLLAESLGFLCAIIYLIYLILFLPAPFMKWFQQNSDDTTKPYIKLSAYLSALLSLQSMAMLGFADDVFDIRWRHKICLPIIASIPLLVVYYLSNGLTYVVLPSPFRGLFGKVVELGSLYYIYMGLMGIFCTHSINILAGVNGVEVGQSLVIGVSIMFHCLLGIQQSEGSSHRYYFTLYFILPFICISFALYLRNKYPAQVFVGDAYCYFAGMTFAVVGILGHFSKTLLLFFIPQVFNFIYSTPQLFRLIDCPRHRMPIFVEKDNVITASYMVFKEPPSYMLTSLLLLLYKMGIVDVKFNSQGQITSMNNLTLLNFILVHFGPMPEAQLTQSVILVQILGSLLGFTVRYPLAIWFYS